jgi:hypothetical protein
MPLLVNVKVMPAPPMLCECWFLSPVFYGYEDIIIIIIIYDVI